MPDIAALDMGTNSRFQPALSATTDAPTLSTVSKEENTPVETKTEVVEKVVDKGVDSTLDAAVKPKEDESSTPDHETGTDSAANAKSKGGFQKRIDEITKQREEAKREKEDYARRLDEALKIIERANPPQRDVTPNPVKDASEPQREQFDDPDQYAKALSQWSTKQALEQYKAEETRKADETRSAGEFQKVLNDWDRNKVKAIEKHPDYQEVAENPDLQVAQHVGMAVLNVPNGHDVLYWLGQNPAEATRISALQAPFAAIEIGRLSERLSVPTPTSKAPAPTKPLAGNANDAGKIAPEDDPGYMERRLQEMRKRK